MADAMTAQDVAIAHDGAILRITLSRPAKRNALTRAMYTAIADAMEAAAGDGTTRIILFASEGPLFTAGNDLADFMNSPPEGENSPVSRFLHAIVTTPLILIAAVQGRAVGVGTTMLLHCDFVVAAENAELHMPFVDLALVPEAASSLLLPRLIGHQRAARLLMLGEICPAREALALGLVSEIAPADGLLAAANALAQRLLAKPASALRISKSLMKPDLAAALAHMKIEGAHFSAQLASPEFHANAAAFFANKSKAS